MCIQYFKIFQSKIQVLKNEKSVLLFSYTIVICNISVYGTGMSAKEGKQQYC